MRSSLPIASRIYRQFCLAANADEREFSLENEDQPVARACSGTGQALARCPLDQHNLWLRKRAPRGMDSNQAL